MLRMFWLLLIFLILLLAAGFYFFGGWPAPHMKTMHATVGAARFRVEVADTVLSRAQGLSGREGLGPEEGMLFVFSSSSKHGFWMKDMKFSIDIVWIQDDEVAGVTADVLPQPDATLFGLKVYHPPVPVNKVLELAAGAAAKHGINTGDKVVLMVSE